MALFPLPIVVELLINDVWTDISQFVYQRDLITITGGLPPRGAAGKPPPAKLTLTLNNRDGRFSPQYTGGAYYPYLKRNVQIRVSLASATSSSGNVYSGYRFWGEMPHWPPASDITGTDVYVPGTASGPLRRVRQGGGKGSALTRYYATLTGAYAPIAYWPCEEDPDTTIVGAGIDGGTDMTVTVGTPKWKAVSDFNGSAPIGILNNSTWDGLTGSAVYSGNDVYNTPGTYTWVAPVASVSIRCTGPGGLGASSNLGSLAAGPGGGEDAAETGAAVTVGNAYTFTVPAGDGTGTATVFVADAVTVTAHAGGNASANTPGAGGAGSTNATHFNGGNGSAGASGNPGAGGSSAGSAVAGNNASGTTGGAAPAGGGKGANAPTTVGNGNVGGTPGGGGSGAKSSGSVRFGGQGGAGQVVLTYTPPAAPAVNVIRFIVLVPKHGGNNGKVLLRALTGGTIAKLDVQYATGGNIKMLGYNSGGTLLFTSGNLNVGDGQMAMVSAELSNSGTSVAWKLTAIVPGASTVIGSVTGTQATASVGNVSEIIAAPNADVTKTAMGHISLQYALIPLTRVSRALHGHHTEMGIDRFIRLCNEQALANEPQFSEAVDHWGFETGTQSWVGTNGTVTQSAVSVAGTQFYGEADALVGYWRWPADGTHSLLLTANGAGAPKASSPTGTSGQPVQPGDIVSAALELYAPATWTSAVASIDFYNGAGTYLSSVTTAIGTIAAGTVLTVKVTTGGTGAPATAAFWAVSFGSSATQVNGTLLYGDNVRVHPRMGPHTRKEYHKFLEEIEDLDQGILKESKKLWGLGYRTRFALINQSPAVTLDYSAAMLSDPLAPVTDDQRVKNHITVHRHKGSKVTVTLDDGAMSVREPPAGTGRYRKHLRVTAERDEQLLALANHLLTLGTASDARYPTITVNLARAGIAGHSLAPLMSAVAGVEIGDRVVLSNLPFWHPGATASQLVVGYTETLSAFAWNIVWNCVPEAPYEIIATNIRRW